MKQTTPTYEHFGLWRDSFRSHVHEIIEWGYRDALPMIQSQESRHHEETSITGFIVGAIRKRLRVENRPWLKHISVHEDLQIEIEGRVGNSRLKVDIVIEWANAQDRPQYMFEAKRIKTEIGRYLGLDGLGCFIEGRYADRCDEAAMLGYVQSHSLEHWKNRISQRINSDKGVLKLRAPMMDVQFEKSFPLEWVSEHYRNPIGRPIRIFHILLDCRQAS